MISRGKISMSEKLARQLAALEREPACVTMGEILDAISDKLNGPKRRRKRKIISL